MFNRFGSRRRGRGRCFCFVTAITISAAYGQQTFQARPAQTAGVDSALSEAVRVFLNRDYDKAVSNLSPLADMGDTFAQLLLVEAIERKTANICDPSSAGPSLARKLADSGLRSGYRRLVDCSDDDNEKKKLSSLAETAKAKPDARAQIDRGLAVLRGYADSRNGLAQYYYSTIGVSEGLLTPEIAESSLRKAAGLGVPEAEFAVGAKYETGSKPDIILALTWLRNAADHNLPDAQAHLALLFESGANGVQKNMAEAGRWYKAAADNKTTPQRLRDVITAHLNQLYGPLDPLPTPSSTGPATADTLAVAVSSEILSDVEDQIKSGAPINALGSDGSASLSPLQRAAWNGNLAIVRFLLDHGADVNVDDEHGRTALHMAHRDAEIVRLLVAKGADLNAKDDEGETPLHLATKESIMQALLAGGADVNAKNNKGETAIVAILKKEFTSDAVEYEPNCGIGPIALRHLSLLATPKANLSVPDAEGNTALSLGQKIQTSCKHTAGASDASAMARILKLGPPGPRTATHLVCAVASKDLARVKAELDDGAPVNGLGYECQDFNRHWTPLALAAREGSLALVKFLIDHGADAKMLLPDNNSNGLFDVSVLNFVRKDPEIAKLLIAKGADPNAKASSSPALHSVAISDDDVKQRIQIVNALLAAGADVNAKDSAGFNILTSVVNLYTGSLCSNLESELPLISTLLAAKADPTIVNINGDTALSLAEKSRTECEDPSGKAATEKLLKLLNNAATKR